MLDTSRIDAEGKIAFFHFTDGWQRRAPVDARDNIRVGAAIQEPTQEQFEAYLATLAPEKRLAALVWPEKWPVPAWLPALHEKLVAPLPAVDPS